MRRWRGSQILALIYLGCLAPSEPVPRVGEEALDLRALPPCELAIAKLDGAGAVAECRGVEWAVHERLGQAWLLRNEHPLMAFATAESLTSTAVATDAHYLAGLLAGASTKGELSDAQAEYHLQLALDDYRAKGRHRGASRAAVALSRVHYINGRYEPALEVVEQAFVEAEASGDSRIIAQAWLARAEVYDTSGWNRDADKAFEEAQSLFTRPDDLAYAFFKHALFVLDLEGAQLTLDLLAKAEELGKRARELGYDDSDLKFAIQLNRAVALSLLRRFADAEQELVKLGDDLADEERAKVMMVRGLSAAQQGELEAAELWFEKADVNSLETDYAVTSITSLARLYREKGRTKEAIAFYQKAIDLVEAVRADSNNVELRPWILARRRQPYVGKLELLALDSQGRSALGVAEALHGRALLDVLVSRESRSAAAPDSVRETELRLRTLAAPSLASDKLLELVETYEALVYVTVDDGFWRLHVVNGEVRSRHFGQDDLAAIDAYRDNLGDDTLAARAAAILLPDELTASDQPLILVGDIAWKTPFAALKRGLQHLVEIRPTAYLPSLAALECNRRTWDGSSVVLGDAQGTLDAARAEALRVADARSIEAFTGSRATWTSMAKAMNAQLLHVAVHGQIVDHEMKLALADGDVTARQVLEAGIAPAEVVLSGCNTANAVDAPESWSGFPSAFLAGGSLFVISTLQSVGDAAAADLVAAYYESRKSLAPARALQAAQLAVKDRLDAKDWASFTAWGSPACELQ